MYSIWGWLRSYIVGWDLAMRPSGFYFLVRTAHLVYSSESFPSWYMQAPKSTSIELDFVFGFGPCCGLSLPQKICM